MGDFGFLGRVGENPQYLFFSHDEIFPAVNRDLSPRIFPEQNAITWLHLQWNDAAVYFYFAPSDRQHFAFLWFVFGSVRNDDASTCGFLLFNAPHQNAIVKRCELDRQLPTSAME